MKTRTLLQRPHWTARNIAEYVGCGLTKGYEIMRIVREEYGGTIKHLPSYVRRDSVLAFLGTTIEEELKVVGDD